jgi:hypothetical protein
VFDRCYPASFPTVPACSDLVTGRYTFTYLPWGPLPQEEITLADCMTKAGYTTTGIADPPPFFFRNGDVLTPNVREALLAFDVKGKLFPDKPQSTYLCSPSGNSITHCVVNSEKR